MIQVYLKNIPELEYVVTLVFKDFLGLEFNLNYYQKNYVEIVLKNERTILIKDHFFSNFNNDTEYLKTENIPSIIKWIQNEFTENQKVPVLFGDTEVIQEGAKLTCGVDIFAGAFFMLSRWEESLSEKNDRHDRFLSENALSVRFGFHEKPVVDQYVEMLWRMMETQGVVQQRKKMDFNIEVSHDVDIPFMFQMYPFERAVKKILLNSLKKKRLFSIYDGLKNWIEVKKGNVKKDPFYTFDEIIDISNQFSLKSTFFFLTGVEKGGYNGHYDINSKAISDIISYINTMGHKIGLHASYRSYDSEELLKKEYSVLKRTLSKLAIEQEKIGSRQHFLRWKTPETFQNLEDAGIDYDSTMTYPDKVGFRCGTCHPYRVFNIKTRKTLNLIERPLIVMDCTLTATRYMNLSWEDALKKALSLKSECQKYNGVFSLLWHNTEFADIEKVELYMEIIKG